MKLATWNVNSIRARLERVVDWTLKQAPDVLCLQELKCLDEQFPREVFEDLGYRVATYGQKTYNGVAILSKQNIEDVVRGFPGEDENAQRRAIGAQIGDLLVLNLYVVNGESVGSEKYAYKMQWMQRCAEFIRERYDMGEKVVVCGDFNVTFDDRDVHDPAAWHEKVLCSTPERRALAELMEPGLIDAFRHFHAEGGHYTWWDFRTRGFQRNDGLRIDHLLMSKPALEACQDVVIDKAARGGEKPSDHAPVIAEFA
ncbi:MAG: exodeoxyribonuclease III [Planctomycetes bacterium]|nr:exodeoxyribonuclease III [Planctomycetota bacterium]